MELLHAALFTVGRFIQKELSEELMAQGHKATGDLINSIKFDISNFGSDGMVLDISFFKYGIFVDSGRKAGKKRVPMVALIAWVIEKGIARGDAEVLRAAYAIREKIFKEGIPTKDSFQYSNNGRRTGWFTNFVDSPALEQMIITEVSEGVGQSVEAFFDNLVEQNRQAFQST